MELTIDVAVRFNFYDKYYDDMRNIFVAAHPSE